MSGMYVNSHRAKVNDVTEENLQAKVDFYANQKQLDSLFESSSSKNAPEVIASSLAAIGGGGNVYAPSFSVA